VVRWRACELSLGRERELYHSHGRARTHHRETDIVHERLHNEDTKAANAEAIRIDAIALAGWIEAGTLIGDFNRKLTVAVRTRNFEMSAIDVTMLGGIVACLTGGEGYVVYVTAEQPATTGEDCNFSARF
jgi:hypothetical protein